MQALTRPRPAVVRAAPMGNACSNNRRFTRPTSTAVNEAMTTTPSSSSENMKLVGPEPQRFVVAEGELQNIASAAFVTMIRGGAGALALGYKTSLVRETPENKGDYTLASLPFGFRIAETSTAAKFPRPAEPLIIYDAQDANSRKIREAVCILDLDTMFKPCPEGANTHKKELSDGSASAPFMIDPNNGTELSDADEIVAYLFRNYGNNKIPLILRKGPVNDITAKLGMAPRKEIGATYTGNGKIPAQPLEYWAYEASPFCTIVREVLSELEIPHILKPVARGSTKRQELFDRRGHFQAPYMEDPNTGVAMFESTAIIEYLRKTYGSSS